MDIENNIKKGRKAEKYFKKWLNKNKIPYLYINQGFDDFSESFKNHFSGKRPDFMVLIPNFGFIFVDVKYRKLNLNHRSYPIDCDETKKYSSFQRKFNMHIWYAISNEELNYQTWLWIPISRVLELGVKKQISSKSRESFFPISPEEFIQISHNDSLERLFSNLFK